MRVGVRSRRPAMDDGKGRMDGDGHGQSGVGECRGKLNISGYVTPRFNMLEKTLRACVRADMSRAGRGRCSGRAGPPLRGTDSVRTPRSWSKSEETSAAQCQCWS